MEKAVSQVSRTSLKHTLSDKTCMAILFDGSTQFNDYESFATSVCVNIDEVKIVMLDLSTLVNMILCCSCVFQLFFKKHFLFSFLSVLSQKKW